MHPLTSPTLLHSNTFAHFPTLSDIRTLQRNLAIMVRIRKSKAVEDEFPYATAAGMTALKTEGAGKSSLSLQGYRH
jgi:hypothetical protein